MNKVLTTVGTSILTNYFTKNNKLFNDAYESIKYAEFSKKSDKFISKHIDTIRNIFKSVPYDEKLCAEIKTLIKIKKKLKSISTILFHSDTVTGFLSSELIQKYLKDNEIDVIGLERIEHLDVFSSDDSKIKKGLNNLIKSVLKATEISGFNISGGYKAFIPTMTLLASYKKCPSYYIFEESDYLIEVPPFPIALQPEICIWFKEIFNHVFEGNCSLKKYLDFTNSNYLHEESKPLLKSLFIENDIVEFSELGEILYTDYIDSQFSIIVESQLKIENKKIEIRDDHGKDKLLQFAKKLVRSSYINGVVNSLPYNPAEKNFIHKVREEGLIELVLTETDKGLGLVVHTTGRNLKETLRIAAILNNEFNK